MGYLRIESFCRAHMDYKRPDGGLKIPRSAHEKRIQFLYLHILFHYNCKIRYSNHIRGLNVRNIRAKYVGVIPSSETENKRPVKLKCVKKLSTQEKEI